MCLVSSLLVKFLHDHGGSRRWRLGGRSSRPGFFTDAMHAIDATGLFRHRRERAERPRGREGDLARTGLRQEQLGRHPLAEIPRDNEALPFLDPRILQREEAGDAGERGEQRRGPERVILRDIARREARRAPRLQPGAVVELSIVATSLWQRPGVLLDGARVDGVGPRAAADLHRPRVPQAARLRQADRERVVLPRRRHRRGTTASMM